jgi:hypothetical protein
LTPVWEKLANVYAGDKSIVIGKVRPRTAAPMLL